MCILQYQTSVSVLWHQTNNVGVQTKKLQVSGKTLSGQWARTNRPKTKPLQTKQPQAKQTKQDHAKQCSSTFSKKDLNLFFFLDISLQSLTKQSHYFITVSFNKWVFCKMILLQRASDQWGLFIIIQTVITNVLTEQLRKNSLELSPRYRGRHCWTAVRVVVMSLVSWKR